MLGSYVTNFRERRGVSLRGKLTTVALIWLPLTYSVYRLYIPWLELLLLLMGVTWGVLMLRMKTLRDVE